MCQGGHTTDQEPDKEPSRHSPPASRPRSLTGNLHPELDNIESLAEVRGHEAKWAGFVAWLGEQSEGEDSEGSPLSLARYIQIYI